MLSQSSLVHLIPKANFPAPSSPVSVPNHPTKARQVHDYPIRETPLNVQSHRCKGKPCLAARSSSTTPQTGACNNRVPSSKVRSSCQLAVTPKSGQKAGVWIPTPQPISWAEPKQARNAHSKPGDSPLPASACEVSLVRAQPLTHSQRKFNSVGVIDKPSFSLVIWTNSSRSAKPQATTHSSSSRAPGLERPSYTQDSSEARCCCHSRLSPCGRAKRRGAATPCSLLLLLHTKDITSPPAQWWRANAAISTMPVSVVLFWCCLKMRARLFLIFHTRLLPSNSFAHSPN